MRLTHIGTPWRDHCHDTLTLVLSTVGSAATPTRVGISVQWRNDHFPSYKIMQHTESLIRTLQWKTHCPCYISLIHSSTSCHSDSVVCIAVDASEGGLNYCWVLGQGGTGCCGIVHCVPHHRASLKLVVNSYKVNTCKQTVMWPLPWHADTCVIYSGFSSQS